MVTPETFQRTFNGQRNNISSTKIKQLNPFCNMRETFELKNNYRQPEKSTANILFYLS